jgi:hypothetical protein
MKNRIPLHVSPAGSQVPERQQAAAGAGDNSLPYEADSGEEFYFDVLETTGPDLGVGAPVYSL